MTTLSFRSILLIVAVVLFPCNSRAEDRSSLSFIGATAWHKDGYSGRGITIAILDNGFRGYREHLGKTLPNQIPTRSFRIDGNLEAKDSQHGLLCAEIVHSIAPNAQLLIANWEPDRPEAFLEAVRWCREQGASIITCSIVMPGWSDGQGGGAIHRRLRAILGDALFVASAGNLAQRHWSGDFHDDGQKMHQWKPGRAENVIQPWGTQPVSVEVTGKGPSTYRISVLDENDRQVGTPQSLPCREANGSTLRFQPQYGRAYRVKLERMNGATGNFRLLVLGADLEIATDNCCPVFPGDGPEVIAVGAISSGGNRLHARSTAREAMAKPECVALVPFPCASRATPFGGTSAAAPQAAGMAALLWSRDRNAKGSEIRQRLLKDCADRDSPGSRLDAGIRLLKLPKP
jgi:subtilisin family serine protease